MLPTRNGALHLFRAFGIDVYLHWSWFFFAIYEYQARGTTYGDARVWNIIEYLGLFAIVLMHEFGHALACRQVGGEANQIVLWPLGGVAYVAPPQRPGAVLWSIAAGPLVNVGLGILSVAVYLALSASGQLPWPGAHWWICLKALAWINLGLLVFNVLPIYPLDGGQILQSLLWFAIGRGRSLRMATVIGFIGAAGFAALALYTQQFWFGIIAFFIFSRCQAGWRYARALLLLEGVPRRTGVACPHCHQEAPQGELWRCVKCQQAFDPFAYFGACPHCQARYAEIWCLDCGQWGPLDAWEHGSRSAAGPRAPTSFPSAERLPRE